MENNILIRRFRDIDLSDPFFDSLKEGYKEFASWFQRKADETAYVMEDNGKLQAFLYLKVEDEAVTDVTPNLPPCRRIKMGTFKINPHGTKLGERFLKRAFDYAIRNSAIELYVTVFSQHTPLINLFTKYGFVEVAEKTTVNGIEKVLLKKMHDVRHDTLLDYPLIKIGNTRKYLLAIYPQYHTQLFPDSILKNENFDVLEDVSHTNSIHKVYICFMDLRVLKPSDVIVIYRTSDNQGPAEYRSVATSICVVEEIHTRQSFKSPQEYVKYCESYSVFNRNELMQWYNRTGNLFVIKMTYNAAFKKRITRGTLINEIGLDRNTRWSFIPLSDVHFRNIVNRGGVDESVIVDQAGVR